MRKFAKAVNSIIELTADFTGIVGQVATPNTSATVTVYEGNTDTKTVNAQMLLTKDGNTGIFNYDWNISAVASGHYNVVYAFVNAGFTYYETEEIVITTKSIDGI